MRQCRFEYEPNISPQYKFSAIPPIWFNIGGWYTWLLAKFQANRKATQQIFAGSFYSFFFFFFLLSLPQSHSGAFVNRKHFKFVITNKWETNANWQRTSNRREKNIHEHTHNNENPNPNSNPKALNRNLNAAFIQKLKTEETERFRCLYTILIESEQLFSLSHPTDKLKKYWFFPWATDIFYQESIVVYVKILAAFG